MKNECWTYNIIRLKQSSEKWVLGYIAYELSINMQMGDIGEDLCYLEPRVQFVLPVRKLA